MDKKFMCAKEAAAFLGVKMNTLYQMTSRKTIPYYSPGGKRILFKESELIEWIEKSRVSSEDELITKTHNMS